MHLCLVGVDHTTAPVAVRERLAFSAEQLPAALAQLTTGSSDHPAILREAAIISTCNRVEIYGIAADAAAEPRLIDFLAAFHSLVLEDIEPYIFSYSGEAVAAHLCATAAGLRSIVLGEAQIQGQVRGSLEQAQHAGSAGPALSLLFRQALVAGKRVRHETALGQGAASVSQAGVELARQRLGSLEGLTVLLVGSGKISELAAQNLRKHGAGELLVVNRTEQRAAALAARWGGRCYPFSALPEALTQADIVISSTAAPIALIGREQVAAALEAKQQAQASPPQMLLLDLAVPRDIDPDVAELPGVEIWTVDDLEAAVGATLTHRQGEVAAAEAIVAQEVDAFGGWLRGQDALPTLAHLRQHAEALRHAEVERAMRRLTNLSPEQQQVVEALTQSLVNKLLHTPTVRLRHAAASGDGQRYATMLRDLFDLQAEYTV